MGLGLGLDLVMVMTYDNLGLRVMAMVGFRTHASL